MHDIGVALKAVLLQLKCPVPVVDGPEPMTSTNAALERVVIEHAPDAFGPPRSQHQNPKHHFTRSVGGKITIFAQSTKAGAMPWEHIARGEKILGPVLVALRYAAAYRKVHLSIKGGQFVPIEDLAKGAQPGSKGVKYELPFTIDTAITGANFEGAAAPEATVGPGGVVITNTTQASLANGPDGDDAPAPETACGGE